MTASTPSMISVRGVKFSYQNQVVLDDLTFEIHAGEWVSVTGPSGSGKSTLFYLLGALMQVDQGHIAWQGQRLDRLSEASLSAFRGRTVGFIFQQFHLMPGLDVLQNVLLPGSYPLELAVKNPEQLELRARELLEEVGLTAVIHHLPNQLSGGQQQRVAIARALLHDPDLILADEPTGNLDSKSSEAIQSLLASLHRRGKTLVTITHDPSFAEKAERTLVIQDGRLVEDIRRRPNECGLQPSKRDPGDSSDRRDKTPSLNYWAKLVQEARVNLFRSRTRSLLTLFGVTVGVAAVLAMISFGQFVRAQVLAGYSDMGADRVNLWVWTDWNRAAKPGEQAFTSLKMRSDIEPLKRLFPSIRYWSPMLNSWGGSASFAGKQTQREVIVNGLNEYGLVLAKAPLDAGKMFSELQVEQSAAVCLIGVRVQREIFGALPPLGQVIQVDLGNGGHPCRVIGTLGTVQTSSRQAQVQDQIWLPYTYFQSISRWWERELHQINFVLDSSPPVDQVATAIETHFKNKYGSTVIANVHSEAKLLREMGRFLTLFGAMLTGVALLTLTVGGIGLYNMMLVSLAERMREFGLRRALGATPRVLRHQLQIESILLCGIGGVIGIVIGTVSAQGLIYAVSKVNPKVIFAWNINPVAILAGLSASLLTGLVSGWIPARRASRLSVIEALRSE